MYIVAGGSWVSVSIKPGGLHLFFWIPGIVCYWFVAGFMGWLWLTGLPLLLSVGIGLTVIGCILFALLVGKWLLWVNCRLV